MDSTTIWRRSWNTTRNRRRKKRSWNTMRNHRKMLPAAVPFCAKDSWQEEQEPSVPGCWPMGYRYRPSPKNEMPVSHRETWPFSGCWLRSKSSKATCGNNTTNWEASRTAKSRGGSGSAAYIKALQVLDGDMSQYIHDNTEDESSHMAFINSYLASQGADPVNLDTFRTLPSSKATGAQHIGRLTNLMQLTVDTSWWTRYRSRTQNPDLGGTFAQAIPGLSAGKFPAIPRHNGDLAPANHIQAIANTAGFHFGYIEQGGYSLYQ